MHPAPTQLRFKIHGMDCAEEVAVLKREVGPVAGGESRLSFDILNGKMTVTAEPGAVSLDAILGAVQRTGMRAEVWQTDKASSAEQGFWQRYLRTILTTASGLMTVAGFLVHAILAGGIHAAIGAEGLGLAHHVPVLAKVIYTAGILAGLWVVLPKAWFALRRLRPDMNLLMTIAVAGAVAIGEWFEAATVAFLFALSLSLESWSVGRARRAVEALMDLAPVMVRVRGRDGQEELVPPGNVTVGSLFIVQPGERLPLDGNVVRGTSSVNQAPITGESVPVLKKPGDAVFAGTVNGCTWRLPFAKIKAKQSDLRVSLIRTYLLRIVTSSVADSFVAFAAGRPHAAPLPLRPRRRPRRGRSPSFPP